MRIVFFGTPEFVVPVLEMLDKEYEVVACITAPDARSGRRQKLTPTPVKRYAEKRGIKVITSQKWSSEVIEQLQALQPDFLIVAAYGQIIPQKVLDIPRVAPLNIHPSLLPKYRGPSPIQAAILHGDNESGVTIIEMDAEVDHGPILAQEKHLFTGHETFLSLAGELFTTGGLLLTNLLPAIVEERANPAPQDHNKATFTEHVTKQNGYIDINKPPSKEQIDGMIRAYYPWPGVFFRIKIKEQRKIVKLLPEKKVQMEGKNPVSVKDFLNGYPELSEVIEKLI